SQGESVGIVGCEHQFGPTLPTYRFRTTLGIVIAAGKVTFIPAGIAAVHAQPKASGYQRPADVEIAILPVGADVVEPFRVVEVDRTLPRISHLASNDINDAAHSFRAIQ